MENDLYGLRRPSVDAVAQKVSTDNCVNLDIFLSVWRVFNSFWAVISFEICLRNIIMNNFTQFSDCSNLFETNLLPNA